MNGSSVDQISCFQAWRVGYGIGGSIELNGRIGLAAKDYAMHVKITPYVTSNLPLVATLVGGPIVGVATWVADRMISSQVSKATTYQYLVTGPWANPVWHSK